MKTLRMVILLGQQSRAALTNTFGEFEIVKALEGTGIQYAKFKFPNVKMLTWLQLLPIHTLIQNYEKAHGELIFKSFHLEDEQVNQYSPFAVHCHRGIWYMVNTLTFAEGKQSNNLLTLLNGA